MTKFGGDIPYFSIRNEPDSSNGLNVKPEKETLSSFYPLKNLSTISY